MYTMAVNGNISMKLLPFFDFFLAVHMEGTSQPLCFYNSTPMQQEQSDE